VNLGGICNDRPRDRKSGRLGVLGTAVSSRLVSSFDFAAADASRTSRMYGEGSSEAALSDRDRVLGDGLTGVMGRSRSSGRLVVVSSMVSILANARVRLTYMITADFWSLRLMTNIGLKTSSHRETRLSGSLYCFAFRRRK